MKLESAQAKAAATVLLGLGALLYVGNGVNAYLYTRAEGAQLEKRQDEQYRLLRDELREMRQDIKKLLEQRRR